MKKLFIVLGILAFGASFFMTSLSAQELKFDGIIQTGLGMIMTDVAGNDNGPKLVPYTVSGERRLGQYRLNGSYTNAEKTIGAKFRLQARDEYLLPALAYFYGYANLFNNVLGLNAGMVDDGTFRTGDAFYDGDYFDKQSLGALIVLRPIDALAIGTGAYVGEGSINDASKALLDTSRNGVNLKNGKYTLSAAYTLPDIFKVVVSYRTEQWNPDATPEEKLWNSGASSKLYAGVRILAVKDLTLNLVALLDHLGPEETFNKTGTFTGFLTTAYKVNDLGFGLNTALWTTKADVKDKVSPTFWLWGSYTLGKFVPRLDLVYGIGNWGNANAKSGIVDQWKRLYVIGTPQWDNDRSYLSIRPSVTFNLDKKTAIEAGDLIHISMAKDDIFRKDTKDPSKVANFLLENILYLDFKWSF